MALEQGAARPLSRGGHLANLGEAALLAGQLDEATRLGGEAVEFSRRHKERGYHAWALHLLGEVMARRDPSAVEQAEACYREAWTLARELAMRPLVAHCHLDLGKLYRRTGKRHEAQEHVTTATAMYREMDMRFWLEKAETELRE